jgi:predicted transcriptional regulator
MVEVIVSETSVLNSISDEKSLDLFKNIVMTKTGDTNILKKNLRLTRKQYYSRMSRMTKVGLIKRVKGKYILTSLGKVVYEAESMIENALNDYWKLKAIDSILEKENSINTKERNKILDSLIDNQKIKEILLQ